MVGSVSLVHWKTWWATRSRLQRQRSFKWSASTQDLIEFIDFVIYWSQGGGDIDEVVESVAGWIDMNIDLA
jgi:hypothetical protein